jgi:ligand-binding SRPBCC domain-containing protein
VPYRLETRIWLPAPLDTVFGFFADTGNLEAITPPFLCFRVLTPDVPLYRGAIIDYRLRLRGVPFRWRTEITVWEPNARFRDEQRRGPYRFWRHSHLFRSERDGTVVEEGVDYDVPGGHVVHQWVVGPDLVRIFTYRQERLGEIFGRDPDAPVRVVIQRKL